MLKAVKCLDTRVHDGKVMVRFLGEDKKAYEVLLPRAAAIQTVVNILQAAKDLPPEAGPRVEGSALIQGNVGMAIGPNMQPGLGLDLNGLPIFLGLSEIQLAALRDGIAEYLSSTGTRQ